MRAEALEAEAARLRAKAEEDARVKELQRQAFLAAKQKEEARRQELKEKEAARKKAEEERAARQERLESVLQSARNAEARERALGMELERVRIETAAAQEHARRQAERIAWLREETMRQQEVQEAARRTQQEIEETSRLRAREEEERLRVKQELDEKHEQEARQAISDAVASARWRMLSFVAAEERARSELQAMLDRKTFIAEVASQVRSAAEQAQKVLVGLKAARYSSTVRICLACPIHPPCLNSRA